MTKTAWPNRLGYDVSVPGGEWEVLLPFRDRPARALFYPAGETTPTRHGNGLSGEAAVWNAREIG